MNEERPHILVIENSIDDIARMRLAFKGYGFNPLFGFCDTIEDFLRSLEPTIDMILIDIDNTTMSVGAIIDILRDSKICLPIIIMSKELEDTKARDYIRQGAAFYLYKDSYIQLPITVVTVLELARLQEQYIQPVDKINLATMILNSDNATRIVLALIGLASATIGYILGGQK